MDTVLPHARDAIVTPSPGRGDVGGSTLEVCAPFSAPFPPGSRCQRSSRSPAGSSLKAPVTTHPHTTSGPSALLRGSPSLAPAWCLSCCASSPESWRRVELGLTGASGTSSTIRHSPLRRGSIGSPCGSRSSTVLTSQLTPRNDMPFWHGRTPGSAVIRCDVRYSPTHPAARSDGDEWRCNNNRRPGCVTSMGAEEPATKDGAAQTERRYSGSEGLRLRECGP